MARSRWVWTGGVVTAVVIGVTVALLSQSGDGDDPAEAGGSTPTIATPTAPASEPVASPSPIGSQPSPEPAPSASPEPEEPIAVDETGQIKNDGRITIERSRAVTSEARGPGEIEGPAIQVTLLIRAGGQPIDLSTIAVNAYYGDDLTPAITAFGPGGDPFSGTVAAGARQRGVYIFNVPANARDNVVIEVFSEASEAPVRFRGKL